MGKKETWVLAGALVMSLLAFFVISRAGTTQAETSPLLIAVVSSPTPTQTPKETPTPTPKPSPTATPKVGEGCTPGFWKTHTSQWPSPYAPTTTVGSVFSGASAFPSLASATLAQALAFGGGPGADGAAQILLRAAVAALLNSTALSGYPLTTSQVISQTNAALASGDRSAMLTLATSFDGANNLGCPF